MPVDAVPGSAAGVAGVRTAVFPVAGLGTRFLPATKAIPKEMLPIVDRPLIQFAVDEAVAAGITELVFVTSRTKAAIADHFDVAADLEIELEAKGKSGLLDMVRNTLPENVRCTYVTQSQARGLGHAVSCARAAVGAKAFAVLLPDDLILNAGTGCLTQMLAVHAATGSNVIAVQDVAPADTDKYGIVSGTAAGEDRIRAERIVEKPAPAVAPSTLAVVGRYVLNPEIFDCLENTAAGAGGEIQLTDAIAALMNTQEVIAYRFQGTRYDCGSKLGFLQAAVDMALADPEISTAFRDHLQRAVTK